MSLCNLSSLFAINHVRFSASETRTSRSICRAEQISIDSIGHRFTNSEGIFRTIHKVHTECLRTWYQKRPEQHGICPECRVTFPEFGAIPRSMPILDRGIAVRAATQEGSLQQVSMLLAHGPISINDRGDACLKAARIDRADIVTKLLAHGPISSYDRGKAVFIAAARGHLQPIRILIANGPISADYHTYSVARAARIGRADIVRILQRARISSG